MTSASFAAIARRLMSHPAAPFHEAVARAEVETICREHGLITRRDGVGNVLIELKRGRTTRPLVMVAHLDHPGFDIHRRLDQRRYLARFLGGVPPGYFRPGTKLRLLPGGDGARLGRSIGRPADREYEICHASAAKSLPNFAVWELPDFKLRDGHIRGRACDDLIGVAAILATLIDLKSQRRACWAIGAITRAEEIGFGGALALAGTQDLPRRSLVVSLETSREMPPIKMGQGVIVRVGDRSSVFDSKATRFLVEVAGELKPANPGFQFQRALMSGGSCEGTVFAEAGYQTAALCVALGNYHNCGRRSLVAAEFVSLDDAINMVALLIRAAVMLPRFRRLTDRLRLRLRRLHRASRRRLRSTA